VAGDGNLVARAQSAVVTLDQRTGAVSAVQSVRPVTPENPIPRRTRGVAPVRPSRFADANVVISPLVTLDRSGVVMSVVRDACEVSGVRTSTREDVCDSFFEPTAAAIRQWRYERPAQGPIQFYVHVRYQSGAEPTVTQSSESYKEYIRDSQASQRLSAAALKGEEERHLRAVVEGLVARSRELERAQNLYERGLLASSTPATLQADRARLNAELARAEEQLRSVSAAGTASDQARLAAQLEIVSANLDAQRRLEEQYRAGLEQRARAEDQTRAAAETLRDLERRLAEYQREREQATAAQISREPVTAGDKLRPLVSPSGRPPVETRGPNGARIPGLQMPVAVKSVKPTYPAEAKEARLQGTVVLEALVDEKGGVADARVVKGLPQFERAALDAAKQWEFKPATLNGETVPVVVVVELEFNLR
jgi:TonB family protein